MKYALTKAQIQLMIGRAYLDGCRDELINRGMTKEAESFNPDDDAQVADYRGRVLASHTYQEVMGDLYAAEVMHGLHRPPDDRMN